MKKIKFFKSLYKERDWLEEMAAQGQLLTDVTLGFLYHFEQTEPCEKVFEIERFDISSNPTIQELNARNTALETAARNGWEVVTQDEDMNYYFMKEKYGNETDEFYDDDTIRLARAERFRKYHSFEAPLGLLIEWLIISIFCMLILLLMLPILTEIDSAVPVIFGLIYLITTITEIGSAFYNITLGQHLYTELRLSRQEWTRQKQFRIKKRFRKIHQLKTFLQEQCDAGLTLATYENGYYLFEEDSQHYDYFVDTKACLKKRHVHSEISDRTSDLKWYEISMTDAQAYQLKPIGVIHQSTILYKRPHTEEPLPPENPNQALGQRMPSLLTVALIAGALLIGLFLGISVVHMG